MGGVVARAEQLVPLVEVCLDHVGDRLCSELLALRQAIGEAPLGLVLEGAGGVLFAVEDLEHVLVRLFQPQLLGDLVQWEVDLAFQVPDLVQAPVEVEAVLLADLEQELDHPPLEEAGSTTLERGRLDLVS